MKIRRFEKIMGGLAIAASVVAAISLAFYLRGDDYFFSAGISFFASSAVFYFWYGLAKGLYDHKNLRYAFFLAYISVTTVLAANFGIKLLAKFLPWTHLVAPAVIVGILLSIMLFGDWLGERFEKT